MHSSKQQAHSTEQAFWAPPELPWLELRRSEKSRLPYASHFHSGLSAGLILEGRTSFVCAGPELESHLAATGDIVLIEPELPHSCNPLDGAPRSYYMLHLDAGWCARQGLLPAGAIRLKKRVLREPELFTTLLGLLKKVSSGQANSKLEEEFLRIFRRILEDNLHEKAEQTAAALGRKNSLCREAFIRAFRRASGLTPGSYAQVQRLEAARGLLRAGAEISEAALASGYADQSHFHRAFVRYFAVTPRQYKNNRSLSYKK